MPKMKKPKVPMPGQLWSRKRMLPSRLEVPLQSLHSVVVQPELEGDVLEVAEFAWEAYSAPPCLRHWRTSRGSRGEANAEACVKMPPKMM